MVDLATWRTLLYPVEWMFRFFIGAGVIWTATWMHPNPLGVFVYCVMTVGVFLTAVLQVWVLLRFARDRQDAPVMSNG